jgi:hypothetical protein
VRACINCGAAVRDDRSSCIRCGGAAVEFADPGTPAAATAASFATPTPIPDAPHTIWAARLLIGLVVVAVVFGGIIVWQALPKSSQSVPGALKPYVAGEYSTYRNGTFGVHMPKGFVKNRGPFLILGHTVGTRFAAAKVDDELVEVITGRTSEQMHVKTRRQAGDLAEVMRAGAKVGTGPSFERVALTTGVWRKRPTIDAQWKGPDKQVLGMRITFVGRRFVIFLALVHGHPDRVLATLTSSYTPS